MANKIQDTVNKLQAIADHISYGRGGIGRCQDPSVFRTYQMLVESRGLVKSVRETQRRSHDST